MKCPSCGTDNPSDARVCIFCDHPLASRPGSFGETRAHAPQSFDALSPGDLIANRYQVVRELGRGGMGVVYLVKDHMLQDQEMALKMISPALVSDPAAHKRFVQEVLAARSLTHVNIVKVFDLNRHNGQDFFTMEYIPGKTLREWIAERQTKKQAFFLEETIGILSPILSALEHAHSKKVIHRDLKPENIIVGKDLSTPGIKVLDFGLARIMSPSRLTSSAMTLGTAYYMSPEQLSGRGSVDARSDLFSVGVILYEPLTGKIPTGRFKLPGELFQGIPEKLDNIVETVLSTEPEERYDTAVSLQNDLDDAVHCVFENNRRVSNADKMHKKHIALTRGRGKVTLFTSPAEAFEPAERSGSGRVTGSRGGKPQFPGIYNCVRQEMALHFKRLKIKNRSSAEWIYFSFPAKSKGLSLRYRLRDHWAELVFRNNWFSEELVRKIFQSTPIPGAYIAQRGSTQLAIWHPTEEIDLNADPQSQIERFRSSLIVVAKLAAWFTKHRHELTMI